MPSANKKKFTLAIFLIGVLLLLGYLAIGSTPPGERHLQGGGFKQTESSTDLKAGIMEPKEIGESDI